MRIRMYTSPKLRRVSKPIEKITLDVKKLAGKMKRFVKNNKNCLGLAAPQIGKNIRLIVARLTYQDENEMTRTAIEVLVNPRISYASSDLRTQNESCLSCPGYEIAIRRSRRIVVEYQDLDGTDCLFNLVDLQARIIQHEVDHLDGVLIIDKE